jgi:hypothetical protein
MNKKLYIFGVLIIVAIVVAGWLVVGGSSGSSIASSNRETTDSAIKAQATESLIGVLDVANQLYGITKGAAFPYKPLDDYGPSGNFGIYKGVTGESLIEERFLLFEDIDNSPEQGTSYSAVVDSKAGKVISFSRQPHYGFCKEDETPPCGARNQGELDIMVREFLGAVEPDFNELASGLPQYKVEKKTGEHGDHYFFRWEDAEFKNQLPKGTHIDNNPMIQVGITSTGFIFSYDNTVALYRDALEQMKVE